MADLHNVVAVLEKIFFELNCYKDKSAASKILGELQNINSTLDDIRMALKRLER